MSMGANALEHDFTRRLVVLFASVGTLIAAVLLQDSISSTAAIIFDTFGVVWSRTAEQEHGNPKREDVSWVLPSLAESLRARRREKNDSAGKNSLVNEKLLLFPESYSNRFLRSFNTLRPGTFFSLTAPRAWGQRGRRGAD